MSSQLSTQEIIQDILSREFNPILLEVIDDTAAHRGHRALLEQPQAGHFKVIMRSKIFDGLSPVKRHRLVYEKLADLMESRIHALSLNLLASQE